MRRFLSVSTLVLMLVTGVVGCDSFAGRKPDSEATTRATKNTPATGRTVPTLAK